MLLKILIVEDNIDLIDAYRIVFKTQGFDVSVAQDGKIADKVLKEFYPDVILLDIMMPYVNGFQFLKNIRSRGDDIKVIINSNLSQDSEIKKSFELGANEYFRKSDYTAFELADKVKEFLAKAN